MTNEPSLEQKYEVAQKTIARLTKEINDAAIKRLLQDEDERTYEEGYNKGYADGNTVGYSDGYSESNYQWESNQE